MAIPPNGLNNNLRNTNPNNGGNPPGPHTNGFSTDASWDVVEIDDNEFQHYFREQDGRLFHSHGGLPYRLPVDTPEQERLNALHYVVKRLLNQNFLGPVPEVLAPVADRQKLVLDICNGTGRWVIEVASQFPQAQFYGVDIVPIATRRPPENVQFEMHDVNTPVRWMDNTVDFVHARSVSMAFLNYGTLVGEAARVLRPNGLFLSGEWEPLPTFNVPVAHPADLIPATYNLDNMVNQRLHQGYGMVPVVPHIANLLEQSGRFTNITSQLHYLPIGDWHPDPVAQVLGNDMRATLLRYGDSLKPMLREAGYENGVIEGVLRAYVHELHTVPGLMAVYRTVHARKKADLV